MEERKKGKYRREKRQENGGKSERGREGICEKRASKKGISVRGLISQGNSREKKKEA